MLQECNVRSVQHASLFVCHETIPHLVAPIVLLLLLETIRFEDFFLLALFSSTHLESMYSFFSFVKPWLRHFICFILIISSAANMLCSKQFFACACEDTIIQTALRKSSQSLSEKVIGCNQWYCWNVNSLDQL